MKIFQFTLNTFQMFDVVTTFSNTELLDAIYSAECEQAARPLNVQWKKSKRVNYPQIHKIIESSWTLSIQSWQMMCILPIYEVEIGSFTKSILKWKVNEWH